MRKKVDRGPGNSNARTSYVVWLVLIAAIILDALRALNGLGDMGLQIYINKQYNTECGLELVLSRRVMIISW